MRKARSTLPLRAGGAARARVTAVPWARRPAALPARSLCGPRLDARDLGVLDRERELRGVPAYLAILDDRLVARGDVDQHVRRLPAARAHDGMLDHQIGHDAPSYESGLEARPAPWPAMEVILVSLDRARPARAIVHAVLA